MGILRVSGRVFLTSTLQGLYFILSSLQDGATWSGVQMSNIFNRPLATVLFLVDGLSPGYNIICVTPTWAYNITLSLPHFSSLSLLITLFLPFLLSTSSLSTHSLCQFPLSNFLPSSHLPISSLFSPSSTRHQLHFSPPPHSLFLLIFLSNSPLLHSESSFADLSSNSFEVDQVSAVRL